MNKEGLNEENSFAQAKSSLLSVIDINILQNILNHIDLVNGYKYSIYSKKELKISFTLLLKFPLSCKIFSQISKQLLFPLILNNINIDLNYKKYLKIYFLKKRVQKDRSDKEKGNSIFFKSCMSGYYDVTNTLLKYGANINYRLEGKLNDHTPSTIAIFQGNIKTIKKLVKHKNLNINQQNKSGTTPVSFACMYQKDDVVKVLLSRKDIDINIKDNIGRKALDIAKENNYWRKYFFNRKNIVSILQNYEN